MTTSTKPTPAIERAEEAFKAEIKVSWGTDRGWSVTLSDGAMQRALAAALDAEEIARALCRRIHRSLWPLESIPSTRRPCTSCLQHSDAIRAAILGSDQ